MEVEMKRKLIAAGVAVVALGAAGAGAALAFGGGDDGDKGLTGSEANRAAAAALSATGGGTVNAAERDASSRRPRRIRPAIFTSSSTISARMCRIGLGHSVPGVRLLQVRLDEEEPIAGVEPDVDGRAVRLSHLHLVRRSILPVLAPAIQTASSPVGATSAA
jgi:hypothetical protein